MRVEPYGPPYDPKAVTTDPDRPLFLVTFWRPLPPIPGHPDTDSRYSSDERILRGATDITEVFTWADENAGPDRSYQIHVASISVDGDSGMIHLHGTNPTIHYFEDSEPFRRVNPDGPPAMPDIFLRI